MAQGGRRAYFRARAMWVPSAFDWEVMQRLHQKGFITTTRSSPARWAAAQVQHVKELSILDRGTRGKRNAAGAYRATAKFLTSEARMAFGLETYQAHGPRDLPHAIESGVSASCICCDPVRFPSLAPIL